MSWFRHHRHIFTSDVMEPIFMLRRVQGQLRRVVSGHRLYCRCGQGKAFWGRA